MRTLLSRSRNIVYVAVVGALLSALALYGYALADTIATIVRTLTDGEVTSKGAKVLMLYFIQVFDLFLLGTVMLILAFSLYELFIDGGFKIASRLDIHSFDDLKTTLVTVVIAVMAVTFLGHLMAWEGDGEILELGIAVALVILALNAYVWIAKSSKSP